MSRANEDMEEPADPAADRALWQRSRMTDAPADDAGRLLDLAAFADGLLDAEERDRVAAYLAVDPAAAADVAAARALAGGTGEMPGGLEQIVARACVLPRSALPAPARVIAFTVPTRRRILHGVAEWGSLAAAIALASWLGFAMGSAASLALTQPGQPSNDNSLSEVFDPAAGFLSDLGEGLRT